MAQVFGALFVGYTGTPFGLARCSELSCVARGSFHANLTYYFPLWFLGKAMDTGCPLGPVIVPARDLPNPQNVRLTTRVNGEVRQDSNTSDMLYDIGRIIEILSKGLTLEPGDVIITGTPSGVAMGMNPPKWLKDGDVVECQIEGIGVLRNRVVELKD